jgi:hypothetical protein
MVGNDNERGGERGPIGNEGSVNVIYRSPNTDSGMISSGSELTSGYGSKPKQRGAFF